MYSFGYRYYYWDYYKDNQSIYDDAHSASSKTVEMRPKANDGSILGHWYIHKKYKNLKEELLKNTIHTINATQFEHLITKAQIHLKTDCYKSLKCGRGKSAECYEMKSGDPITMNHLAAMMTYCNEDVIQRKFTETFRRITKDETDQSLIIRHRNYYHFGKLLRECVECFGTLFTFDPHEDTFDVYHGLNSTFTFATISAYIKGPFSTTTDYAVAVNFCQSEGMILNLQFTFLNWQIDEASSLACFDCQWISDYSNEQEIFFIGGLNRFEFRTIIDAKIGANYESYIRGLALLQNCTSIEGEFKHDYTGKNDTEQDKQIAFRLLSHEIYRYFPNHEYASQFKSCPEYFMDILHSYCMNVTRIVFRNNPFKREIFEEIFRDQNGWIDVALITTVFPNVEGIGFDSSDKNEFNNQFIENMKNSSICDSILSLLNSKYKTLHLKLISIRMENLFVSEMSNHIQKYQTCFEKYGWNIDVIDDEHSYESCSDWIYLCMSKDDTLNQKRMCLFGYAEGYHKYD